MLKKIDLQLFAEKTLAEILGEELYKQVTEKLGDARIDIVSDGRWIPKQKFDDINEEKKQYKTQVDELNKKLSELKEKVKDNDDITGQIEALKQQIKDKEAELAKTRKLNAIKLAVLKAGPNDVEDILPHLKQDSITLADDGTITGLEEQIKALKEKKPYLFKDTDPEGTGGSKGGGAKDKKPAPGKSATDFINAIREVQAKR